MNTSISKENPYEELETFFSCHLSRFDVER